MTKTSDRQQFEIYNFLVQVVCNFCVIIITNLWNLLKDSRFTRGAWDMRHTAYGTSIDPIVTLFIDLWTVNSEQYHSLNSCIRHSVRIFFFWFLISFAILNISAFCIFFVSFYFFCFVSIFVIGTCDVCQLFWNFPSAILSAPENNRHIHNYLKWFTLRVWCMEIPANGRFTAKTKKTKIDRTLLDVFWPPRLMRIHLII